MAADWARLRDRLRTSGDQVTLTWRELDDLVGGMPRSAIDHAAWWSGERPHISAWRDAGFAVVDRHPGVEVTFRRTGIAEDVHGLARDPDPSAGHAIESQLTGEAVATDILLVTCVKAKAPSPRAAQDLYISPLFVRQRAYAEALGVPWFILSAEHGLVAPEEWCAPYERYLPDTPASYQEAWGRWVVERLALLTGDLPGRSVEIHASSDYVRAIQDPLRKRGAVVLEPLKGLRPGERLAWYDAMKAMTPAPPSSTELATVTPDVSELLTVLTDQAKAVTPAGLRARGSEGLKVPGLYSWWVDEPGAADLTEGLGHAVHSGLIYAGLAGATRWPSGRRSTNTLWGRLNGMHLGDRHKFSTFRRTLGSVLATAQGWADIDEAELTRWMEAHLRVVPMPFPDADELGRMEVNVLEALNPPLNLKDVPPSALRVRLKDLRRLHTH